MRLRKFPSERASRPLRQRSGRSAIIRHGVKALAVLFVLLVIAIGGAAMFLLSGPTEVTAVRERIRGVLQANLGNEYEVSVGKAIVDVDPVLGLVIRVNDLEVLDDKKAVVAKVPSTLLAIDPLSLLRLRVDVRDVELNGAELSFVRLADGTVYLGNSKTAHASRPAGTLTPAPAVAIADGGTSDGTSPTVPADGGFPELYTAAQTMDHGMEPTVAAAIRTGFEHFSLVKSSINVWDAPRETERHFDDTDFTVDVDPATGGLDANFATSGYGGRWTATLEREVDSATGGRSVSVVFSQLTLADLIPSLGNDSSPVVADVPLYGRASLRFSKDGAIEDAAMRLDLGAGTFRFGEHRETVLLDEATVKLHWDVPNHVVVVEPSTFFFGETRGVVRGSIRPAGKDGQHRYAFNLQSNGAILAPRDSPAPPLVAQQIAVSGTADLKAKLITFDNATILAQDASIAAAGSIGYDGPTPSVAMAASFSPMNVDALKQMWPPFIAGGARKWALQHVLGGRITAGRFEAAIPAGYIWSGLHRPLPEDSLRLDFHLEDVSFNAFGDLPPVVNASGNAVLAGSTLGVDLESGSIKTPSGSSVAVTAGAFAIANTAPRVPNGVVEVQLEGSASALGEIANAKPLRALDRHKVHPSDLSGDGTANVSVRLPLKPGITPDDVDWKVTVNVKNFASKVPLEGRTITDGDVNFTVTKEQVAIRGKAKFDGVPADVSMNLPSIGGGGNQQVRLALDDAARKHLGIGLSNVLSGTVGTTVDSIEGSGKGQHYSLDLKNARVTLDDLGWTKGLGVPASLSFDLLPSGKGYSVENIALNGDGFGFTGKAILDSGFNLISANINNFALRKGDSLNFKLTRSRSGYQISARGASFDMRGLIVHLRQHSENNPESPDLTIDARVDKVTGFNQETISNAALNLMAVGGTARKISFAGAIGDGSVSLSYDDSGRTGDLSASADDAGRLARFLDLYSRFSGGSVRLTGKRTSANGPMVGSFEMANFDVLNEPAMKNIVTGSAPSVPASGFNASRVHFQRMVADFRKTDQQITIQDALLRGAAVGATFSGRYDLSTTQLSISGTYLPNYAFNNAFSHIPFVGLFLGGGFREGLVGVTFKITGTLASPRVFYNPLSAVAPGIFRKIFEFQ